jgi:hypothetical protein
MMTADGFAEIEKIIKSVDDNLTWRHFWTLYICNAIVQSSMVSVGASRYLAGLDIGTERGIISAFEKTSVEPQAILMLNDWLLTLDHDFVDDTSLVFDGLDTGFGSSVKERERRLNSVSGLFDLLMNQGAKLKNLSFKIFLREDIWKGLSFENKSHLYGRSVSLKWLDKATYLKVVLKQALRNENFRNFLRPMPSIPLDRKIETWSEDQVYFLWNILVGERMAGGKAAFTRNWIWSRFADGNGDRNPRYLLQLFNEAVQVDSKQYSSKSARSLIRPRALIDCFPKVSSQALAALKEEFKELEPLLKELDRIGRTPLAAADISDQGELVSLAKEVGILSIYEERDEAVVRYKVPDIYRHALRMTRKGRA